MTTSQSDNEVGDREPRPVPLAADNETPGVLAGLRRSPIRIVLLHAAMVVGICAVLAGLFLVTSGTGPAVLIAISGMVVAMLAQVLMLEQPWYWPPRTNDRAALQTRLRKNRRNIRWALGLAVVYPLCLFAIGGRRRWLAPDTLCLITIMLLGTLTTAYREWRKFRRAQSDLWRVEGHCANCGYPLQGLPEARCPECGTPFAKALEDHP